MFLQNFWMEQCELSMRLSTTLLRVSCLLSRVKTRIWQGLGDQNVRVYAEARAPIIDVNVHNLQCLTLWCCMSVEMVRARHACQSRPLCHLSAARLMDDCWWLDLNQS